MPYENPYHDVDKAYSARIEEWAVEAREAIALERDEKRDAQEPSELSWILNQLPAWKRWFLKRNQQKNYFRVTKLVPPGMEDLPFFWRCKFQIWKAGKLSEDYPITPEAFNFFYENESGGWEQILDPGIAQAILRPPSL